MLTVLARSSGLAIRVQRVVGAFCVSIRAIVARARRERDGCANRRGYPPRKPLPAKRIPAHIRSLCRAYTDEAVRSLAAIMRNADAPPEHAYGPSTSCLIAAGSRAGLPRGRGR